MALAAALKEQNCDVLGNEENFSEENFSDKNLNDTHSIPILTANTDNAKKKQSFTNNEAIKKNNSSKQENGCSLQKQQQTDLINQMNNDADSSLCFMQESTHHDALIEALNAKAFGPARFTRAAHLIREDGGHDIALSFVVEDNGELVASIRMTAIKIADIEAYLLGPLVVFEKYKGAGIGRKLITLAIEAAKKQQCRLILLVGDAPYYGRFGFKPIAPGQMQMPAPVDPQRFLALELQEGTLEQARGLVLHKNRAKNL